MAGGTDVVVRIIAAAVVFVFMATVMTVMFMMAALRVGIVVQVSSQQGLNGLIRRTGDTWIHSDV